MRFLLLLCCVVLLTGCVGQGKLDPLLAGQACPVRQSGFVRLHSDLPAATTDAVAADFMAAVTEAAQALAVPIPAGPADLVVLPTSEGRAWGLRGVDGLSMPGPEGRVVVAVAQPLGERDHCVVRHEAVHWLLSRICAVPTGTERLSGVPRWLDEGLATAFEMTGDNRERRQEFTRLAVFRWRALTGLKRTLGQHRYERATSADYARAWAMGTYLLRQDPAALQALVQARMAWCRNQPVRGFRDHERALMAASREEFARIVLRGDELGAWFDRLVPAALASPRPDADRRAGQEP